MAAAGTYPEAARVTLRKALAAEWKRIEAELPDRPLTAAELDELITRWSAIVERVYSGSRCAGEHAGRRIGTPESHHHHLDLLAVQAGA